MFSVAQSPPLLHLAHHINPDPRHIKDTHTLLSFSLLKTSY